MIKTKSTRLSTGFTLIELTIVLFILGLLIAGLVGPMETQLEARDRSATLKSMENIIEALHGYAITNGRLPCPNTDGDGLEQLDSNDNDTDDVSEFTAAEYAVIVSNGADCITNVGFLPWATLGVDQADAWGNRYTYHVTAPSFTTRDSDAFCDGNDLPQEFDLCAVGNLLVQSRGDDAATAADIEGKANMDLGSSLPVVLISHGKNGLGAVSVSGLVRPVPPANTDELQNSDGNETYISRIYTSENTGCADDEDEDTPLCEYDDIVKWISPALLNNRMVAAGQLP